MDLRLHTRRRLAKCSMRNRELGPPECLRWERCGEPCSRSCSARRRCWPRPRTPLRTTFGQPPGPCARSACRVPAAGAGRHEASAGGFPEHPPAAARPVRVLVGVPYARGPGGRRADPSVGLGATPEAFDSIGVLADTVPDGEALRPSAGRRPARRLRRARPPTCTSPPTRSTRSIRVTSPPTRYTWFYDDVRAGDALLAAGGGSRRSIAVMDTGLDVTHPEFAGRMRAPTTRSARAPT